MPRTLSVALALVLAVLGLSACGKKGNDTAPGNSNAIDTATLAPGAKPVAPAADTSAKADTVLPVPLVTHIATILTTTGPIDLELYGKDAPKAVKNFVELAKKKYYDSVLFHRVVPGFMIQTGDPNSRDRDNREAWGTGGSSIYGGTFADELDATTPSGRRGYVTGTLAMANAGPNTNGSQFFIVASTEGAKHLTYNYTIFGMVHTGMAVVHRIEETGAQGEKPTDPVMIESIKVKELPQPKPGSQSPEM
jgi:cyclophilin family peptidyl-prolyl cis-trans isomerase